MTLFSMFIKGRSEEQRETFFFSAVELRVAIPLGKHENWYHEQLRFYVTGIGPMRINQSLSGECFLAIFFRPIGINFDRNETVFNCHSTSEDSCRCDA